MQWWTRAKWVLRSRPALLGSVFPPTSLRKEVPVPLGVDHLRSGFWLGLPWAGVEGLWRVWASGGESCRGCREQPGLSEEQEPPAPLETPCG